MATAAPGARRTLALLTALNVLNYLDRYVAAAVLPLLLADLALSDAQGGMLHTAIIATYTLVCPLAGWAGASAPRFKLAALGALLWSAATFASGLAGGYLALLLARALVGVGEATYAVIGPTLIADTTPPARRGRALAVFYSAIPVGSALGFQLGGWAGTAFGWRQAFFVAGLPGLLLGLTLLRARDPVRGGLDATTAPSTGLSVAATLRALARRRAFLHNTAAQTIYTFALGGLAYWMPTFYTRARGLSLTRATFLFGAILVLSGFLGTLLGGWLGDRLARRSRAAHFTFSGGSLLCALPGIWLAVTATTPAAYWTGLAIALFLLFLNMGPLNAAMINALPPDLRERAYGVNTFAIHALGDAISPALIGLASDRLGLAWPITVTAMLLPLSGLVLLAGRAALRHDLDVLSSPAHAAP